MIREKAAEVVMEKMQPTLREVVEEQEVFACPNCGELTQLGQAVDLDNVASITLETECCGYEETFGPEDANTSLPQTMTDYDVLTDVAGVGDSKAAALIDEGYRTVNDLRRASQSELSDIDVIGNALAARMKADVGEEADDVVEAVSKGEGGSCPVDNCPSNPTQETLYDHMISEHGWYTEDLEVE